MNVRIMSLVTVLLAVALAGNALAQPAPPAYTVIEVEVTNPEIFADFGAQLGAAMAAAGGRLVAVPAGTTVLHEGAETKRIGIAVWPTLEAATAFYTSEAFLSLIPLRDTAANIVRIISVEGLLVAAE